MSVFSQLWNFYYHILNQIILGKFEYSEYYFLRLNFFHLGIERNLKFWTPLKMNMCVYRKIVTITLSRSTVAANRASVTTNVTTLLKWQWWWYFIFLLTKDIHSQGVQISPRLSTSNVSGTHDLQPIFIKTLLNIR